MYKKDIVVERVEDLKSDVSGNEGIDKELRLIEHADLKVLHIMNGFLVEDSEGRVQGFTYDADEEDVWLQQELLWIIAEYLGLLGSDHSEYRLDISVRDQHGRKVIREVKELILIESDE